MPRIPSCAFCRKMTETLKENKKTFLIYSIFYLFIIELISYPLNSLKNYACYWYPLLSNTGLFLLLFSIYLWNDKLRFCFRKNLAILFLSMYYLFGSLSILFKVSDNFYTNFTLSILLLISVLTFILSIFKKID